MTKEFEQYHGIVLSRLIHSYGELEISSDINSDNSSYLINNQCGIYIKYSKKRITPWQFNFNFEHYNAIINLMKVSKIGYVIFVCGFDGLCCVNFNDFLYIINGIDENCSKSVSISRFKNQQYKVSGTDNELSRKYADGEIDLDVCLPV